MDDRKEDSREDTRSIYDLVRDIEGTQEKKKKKRQRTKVKKVENLKDGVKTAKPSYDVDKKKKIEKLSQEKERLELEIGKRQQLLEENEPGNEPELKDLKELLDQINDAEKENVTSKKKMDKMDWEILELKARIKDIENNKAKVNERIQANNRVLERCLHGKVSLEGVIEKRVKRKAETKISIQAEIFDLEQKIVENLKETLTVYDIEELPSTVSAPPDQSQQLLDHLIAKKEADLECPVCLSTATVPIYSCPESHLICSECRPQVTECPECRLEYKDKEVFRRHRYAERMAEELDMLRKERTKQYKR